MLYIRRKGDNLNIVELPITALKPYKNNPKKHTKKQIEQIASSIELTKGLRQPIVIDKDNVIVCGHGRFLAAKKLGYDTVPCELIDNLTDDEIRAYRLIDNRISEGEYDLELEFEELSDIEIDLSDFELDSFSMDEIEEVNGYDENNDEREFFTAAFTFPTAQKEQILKYLRKHKQEITEEIIRKSGE